MGDNGGGGIPGAEEPYVQRPAHTEFKVQYVEILVTPQNPVPSSGSAVGFKRDSFGEVDPESISPYVKGRTRKEAVDEALKQWGSVPVLYQGGRKIAS